MNRVSTVVSLILLSVVCCHARPATGQQSSDTDPAEEKTPDWLQLPPRELLRRGLQPLSVDLPDTQIQDGLVPPDASQGVFDSQAARPPMFRGRQWSPIEYHWLSSELRHRPLYFEDSMLERHGQMRHPLFQPVASGVRFFATFPALPYAFTVEAPCRARAELGRFRPGSTAPLLLQRPPLQVDAGLWEAGAWVGLIFLFP